MLSGWVGLGSQVDVLYEWGCCVVVAADLVFVEYATNDGKVPRTVRTKAYERMLRKVRDQE
jgi:hypothetical protein